MSTATARISGIRRPSALTACLCILGAGLFVQGIVSLVALHWGEGGNNATHGVLNADNRHPWIHIVYGCIILGALITRRSQRELALLAAGFGVFYLGLCLLGVLTTDPFGIRLGRAENVFHMVVGSASLAVGLHALRSLPTTHTAAPS